MREISAKTQQTLLLLLLSSLALSSSYIISTSEIAVTTLVAVASAVVVVAFLRTEAAIYLLIVAMLLSPEIGLGGEVRSRAGKGITLRFDDLLLLTVGAAWFFKTAVYKELNLLARTPLNKPIYLYSLACILSTMLGMQAGRVDAVSGSLFVLKYLEYFLIFWMVINSAEDEKQILRYLIVVFAVAATVSVIAILQIPFGSRVTAPFQGSHGEPNTLASYLLFILALLLGMALTVRKYRLLLLGLISLLLVPFVYTLSRSSYFAFIPMLYVLFYLTRRFALMVGLTLVILAGLLAPSVVLPKVVMDRIQSTFPQGPVAAQARIVGRRFDLSTEARLSAFTNSLAAFKERPILGWGVTGWRFVDSQYLRVITETGLVGSVFFLYLMFMVYATGFAAITHFRDRNPMYHGLAAGFVAGTTALMVNCIGTNVFLIVRIMEPFWLICAIICLLPGVTRQEIPETPGHHVLPA